jgi:hypothetical protein
MQEFETFVYLDLEKTGSTFIVRLLRDHCRETLVRGRKHKAMGPDADRSKFHFISVRNPLELYLSLYSFGCERWGSLRGQLAADGRPDFYDRTPGGFNRWLDYLLVARNTQGLGGGFPKGKLALLLGLQSHRFLHLALADASEVLGACETRDDVRRAYAEHRIADYVVRNEHFAADLAALITGRLAHAFEDPKGLAEHVLAAPPVNPSKRVDAGIEDFKLPDKLMRRLRKREWFLCETFGYLGGAISP